MAQPLSVVVTDSNGNALTITGSTILTDAARIAANQLIGAPEPVVLCDVNGNPLQLQNGGLYGLKAPFGGTVALAGLAFTNIALRTLGSGDNYIYTVPANTRAYMNFSCMNPTAGSITASIRISKDAGVTSFLDSQNIVIPILNGAGAGATLFTGSLILEAGDKVNIKTTATGLIGVGMAQEFANSSGMKQVVFTAFASGDNVVYTCPAGKQAMIPVSQTRGAFTDTGGQCFLSNETGSTVTFQTKLKYSGQATTAIGVTSTVANNADANVTGNTIQTILNPGDQLILNTNSSTAGQVFRCNVFEF